MVVAKKFFEALRAHATQRLLDSGFDPKDQTVWKHTLALYVTIAARAVQQCPLLEDRRLRQKVRSALPATFRDKAFSKNRPQALLAADLIDRDWYDKALHRCFHYWPRLKDLPQLQRWYHEAITDPAGVEWVTVTGTPIRKAAQRMPLGDVSFVPDPVLEEARQLLQDVEIYPEYITELLAALQDVQGDRSQTRSRREGANKLYRSLLASVQPLLQDLQQNEHGQWTYLPRYKFVRTGRMFEVRGGLQTCPSALRDALVGAELHNYDLHAAQLNLLAQVLEQMGVAGTELNQYLAMSAADRETFAHTLGITGKHLKTLVLRTVFGSTRCTNPYTDFHAQLRVEAPQADLAALAAFVEPVRRCYAVLAQRLRAQITPHTVWWRTPAGWVNLPQATARIRSRAAFDRFLVAAWLQGYEMLLVAHLVRLGPLHGYRVVHHQHDGFYCVGHISAQVVAEACRRAGLRRTIALTLKPRQDVPSWLPARSSGVTTAFPLETHLNFANLFRQSA